MDNTIYWLFEKAFDQLTSKGKELFVSPWEQIKAKTFDNTQLHQLIADLSKRPLDEVVMRIQSFSENFLFQKTKRKIGVQILLNRLDKIKDLMALGYQMDEKCFTLIILNNRLDILYYILPDFPKNNEWLFICAEFGYERMYQILQEEKGLVPNVCVYKKAVQGGSLWMVKNINQYVDFSKAILTRAFQANWTDIILFLINEKIEDNPKYNIDKNLIAYPILNNNLSLLKQLEELHLVNWHPELYYSALLSGSLTMISYVENKLGNIHNDKFLDRIKHQGKITFPLEDIIYEQNGEKYFSHTMNYAIQSASLEVVMHIKSLGYGITPSNFVTAIKQGTVEIIEYLCSQYQKSLPSYLFCYLGINCFSRDKLSKGKALISSELLDLTKPIKTRVKEYQKDSFHDELIRQSTLSEESFLDPDYIMSRYLFFPNTNQMLLSISRFQLEFQKSIDQKESQSTIDLVFLFGTLEEVRKYGIMSPSLPIIMELMCYCDMGKLCYLMKMELLTNEIVRQMIPVATMLDNKYLNFFMQKLTNVSPKMVHLAISRNINMIKSILNKDESHNKNTIKHLLRLEDLQIAQMIQIPDRWLDELIEWSFDEDLVEINQYLSGKIHDKSSKQIVA